MIHYLLEKTCIWKLVTMNNLHFIFTTMSNVKYKVTVLHCYLFCSHTMPCTLMHFKFWCVYMSCILRTLNFEAFLHEAFYILMHSQFWFVLIPCIAPWSEFWFALIPCIANWCSLNSDQILFSYHALYLDALWILICSHTMHCMHSQFWFVVIPCIEPWCTLNFN